MNEPKVYNWFNREIYNGLRKMSQGWQTGNIMRHIHPELFNLYGFDEAKKAVNILIRISLLSIEPNKVDIGDLDETFVDISHHARRNLSFGIAGSISTLLGIANEFFNSELAKARNIVNQDSELAHKRYLECMADEFSPFRNEADCIIESFNHLTDFKKS